MSSGVVIENREIEVAIIDYGVGNLFSIQHACRQVGISARITADSKNIVNAAGLILPGVGSFPSAMQALRKLDLVSVLKDVAESKKPMMGVCLGMQLLMTESLEFGQSQGLNLIPGRVIQLASNGLSKIPHVGWNPIYRAVEPGGKQGLRSDWPQKSFQGITQGAFMYFTHSYYVIPEDEKAVSSYTPFGDSMFCASVEIGNLSGFQFHPERSGSNGLKIYANFKNRVIAAS